MSDRRLKDVSETSVLLNQSLIYRDVANALSLNIDFVTLIRKSI